MGRPRKSLYDLAVRDRTFRARMHAQRLIDEPLLEEAPALRAIQLRYRAHRHPLERAEIAREFQHAVQRRRDPLAEAIDAIDVDREIAAILASELSRRKSLHDRVLAGTFVARKHAHLLEEDDLGDDCPRRSAAAAAAWRQLHMLIRLYRMTPTGEQQLRQQIARDFAHAALELAPRKRKERP
jgi:hypothetical protein